MPWVLAVDAGTTGVRTVAVDEQGRVVERSYTELHQHFPVPGQVEHDPMEIWSAVRTTLGAVARRAEVAGVAVAAVGITNQRETVVAWDRRTGRPRHRAIVWQDRRTAPRCEELIAAGHQPSVRARTGLVLDPYFSATKMAWLIDQGGVVVDADLALGTVDSWLVWNLTGGPDGGVYATDATNASRTLLYDLDALGWSEELCALFGVPASVLAEVVPSCGRLGRCDPRSLGPAAGGLAGVGVSGLAGDQQAALFGQACFEPGMAKATYGTGTFVLVNAGPRRPAPPEGLVATLAWDLGPGAGADRRAYALEGSAFSSGAAVQWLRDGLGVIPTVEALEPLAASAPDSGGAVVVPAFTGLGSPFWDPSARGLLSGITRGTNRAQLARAVVEGMANEVRAMVEAMADGGGPRVRALRVDGGAATMDLLLRLQAEQLGVLVSRPRSVETTALGAAMLAGLAEGVWDSLDTLASLWRPAASVEPEGPRELADALYEGWRAAVERSRGWART